METKSEQTGGGRHPQEESRHPGEYEEDLEPNRMAGQNIGPEASEAEREGRTAADVADLHGRLGLDADELRRVPLVPEGARLRQGATYLDLAEERGGEFTATGDMTAESGQLRVAKQAVAYEPWNRLLDR